MRPVLCLTRVAEPNSVVGELALDLSRLAKKTKIQVKVSDSLPEDI